MEISGNATLSNATAAANTGSASSEDFQVFLKMLTTQMKNQDPLSPLEANDLAIQLATFSMVEQQVQTNQNLTQISEDLSTPGIESVDHLVGQRVYYTGPFHFGGSNVSMRFAHDAIPEGAELVVKDEDGLIVHKGNLSAGATSYTWSGIDKDGLPLPAGSYTAEISVGNENAGSAIPVYLTGYVREFLKDDTALKVFMQDGTETTYAQLAGI